MRITVLKLAKEDLRAIRTYLSDYGAGALTKFRARFEEFCRQVANLPHMYSIYEHNSLYRRAVLIYDYLVFYRVNESAETIEVYRVLHGKRNVVPLIEREELTE